MKLIDIILKEISLVKSQKIALLLIFLYPFLAIGLLGTSFSGMDFSSGQSISVGVLNELDFESNIINNISGFQNIQLLEFKDETSLVDAVKKKEILVGLKVSGASPNSQMRVDLFYDNSNLLSSRFFMEIAKALVQRVTIEMTQEKLGEIWEIISSLGQNIGQEKEQVNEFKQRLNEAEEALDDLEKKLNALDIDSIEGTLDSQKSTVQDFSGRNVQFQRELNDFKISFDNLKSQLSVLTESSQRHRETLILILNQLDGQIVEIDNQISFLESLKENTQDHSQVEILENQIIFLKSIRSDLDNWKTDLTELRNLVDDLGDEESNLNKAVSNAESLLERLDKESKDVSSALSSSEESIDNVYMQLEIFKDSIEEVRDLIKFSRKSKDEIESKLESSSKMLSKFSSQIIEFGDIDPKVLAQPVIFYERTVFTADPLGILVANATAIVLILTCMLLTSIIVILERTQNVSQRLLLSPTGKFTLFSGKVIGQLIIAIVEALIIFLVAYFVFGVDIIPIFPELMIATIIVGVSFISLGLLISAFMKNQSTAILTTLLVVVPMLFLSGIILPVEFMEPVMQIISYFMPLTLANNIFIGLIMKQFSLTVLLPELIILSFIVLVVFAIIMLKKEF